MQEPVDSDSKTSSSESDGSNHGSNDQGGTKGSDDQERIGGYETTIHETQPQGGTQVTDKSQFTHAT